VEDQTQKFVTVISDIKTLHRVVQKVVPQHKQDYFRSRARTT